MTQSTLVIANQSFPSFRTALNAALQAQASNQKGTGDPATRYAGQFLIDDDTPTSTLWTLSMFDGTSNVAVGLLDSTNHRFYPAMRTIPGGRLTLTSATPVLSADVTAATTVYYTPHAHDMIPLYIGTINNSTFAFQFSELSLALDSNSGHTGYHQSGKNFDLFVTLDGGTLRFGTGPAWSSDTARGSGAGTTELQRLAGMWTNKNTMTLRLGSASGNTISVAANQATYVGTLRATADGQTAMVFKPSATAGGNGNVLGLYNAFNRVRVAAMSRDSTASWTYGTATWRAANSNNGNRISWIDGLQTSSVMGKYQVGNDNSGSQAGVIGVNLDTTSATPGVAAQGTTTGSTQQIVSEESFPPQLGFHFIQAVEYATGATATFRGVNVSQQQQALIVNLEM